MTRTEQRRRHLTVAGRLLHASGAPDDPFVPRWYLAVSRALREQHVFAVAQDLLERGRARAPGNPTSPVRKRNAGGDAGQGLFGGL